MSVNGNVQILFGSEGIKLAYEMSLKADQLDIVCLSSDYVSVIGDYFDKDYGPRLFRSAIQTREILPDTKGNREDAKKKDGVKNQVRFIKVNKRSESDLMLFADKAIMVSYNRESPYAVLIEDVQLVTNLRNQFEGLWSK